MQSELKKAKLRRARRAKSIRRDLIRSDRPRLSVFRSLKNISGQIIDDRKFITLVGISTSSKEIRELKTKKERAEKAGELLGKAALEKGIKKIVFDRGHNKYHGLIATFAEGARKAGLEF